MKKNLIKFIVVFSLLLSLLIPQSYYIGNFSDTSVEYQTRSTDKSPPREDQN